MVVKRVLVSRCSSTVSIWRESLKKPSRKQKLRGVRVPLLRQTGGVHKVKTKVQFRDRKHKGPDACDHIRYRIDV